METTAANAAQARAQAQALSLQYPPWCLLHMLLKHHKSLLSTLLLEELLPPHNHSQSSATSLSHTQSPAHHQNAHPHHQESPPAPLPRPRALLSRHLIQRLHFGYYGNKQTLSESAVRYLTARARLEYGYFVIRGRAFWNITHEDLDDPAQIKDLSSEVAAAAVPAGRDKKAAAKGAGVNIGSGGQPQVPLRQDSPWPLQAREQDLQQQHQQHDQAQGPIEDNDAGGVKDDDPYRIAYAASPSFSAAGVDGRTGVEDEAEQRRRIAMANQRCEEREEKHLLLEAVRYCMRCQPDMEVVFDPTAATYSPIIPATLSSERQAAAEYWRRVAYTSAIGAEASIDPDDLASIPPTPFLGRRVDSSWMKRLQQSPVSGMQYSDHRTLSSLTRMRMVQDDARLFQIASGIFDGLATYPKKGKKPAPSIIDGPLSLSLNTLRSLVFEYGYTPLPEDDQDRKMHYKGGARAHSGDQFEFPSDGSHVVNTRGLKGQGTSIWYFYDLQRTETMVVYLMHKAPEVLDWLFETGFTLQMRCGSGTAGVSTALLLQCCIPGVHAMVRHVYKPPSTASSTVSSTASPTASHAMPLAVGVATVHRELLGRGRKPRRIEFRRQDFVEVLKGIPPAQLGDTLNVMSDLGMDNTVVQDRLVELLQIPGGTSPMMVEKAHLSALASKPFLASSNEESLFAMEDITAISTEPVDSTNNNDNGIDNDYNKDESSDDHDHNGLGFNSKTEPQNLSLAKDLVNNAIQQAFEIRMDLSTAQDPEWKIAFEDTLSNLKLESWIVHPEVSDWVLATMSGSEPAFQTCFDHAMMEALQELLNWNSQQVWRLERWCQTMENQSRSRNIMGGRHQWEDVKSKLLHRRQPEGCSNNSFKNANKDEDQDELMEEAPEEALDDGNEMIGLDIDWTTNDQIILNTFSTVADMPGGSEIVRVSGDGCLLLDNGCLDQELLLCEQETEDGGYSLETNVKVYDYLRKGAMVEEKHLIWLALGLVTATYKGRDVAHIESHRPRYRHHHHDNHRNHNHHHHYHHHYPRQHHHQKRQLQQQQQRQRQRHSQKQGSNGAAVIPVKMACSPEAYQLVWMLASTFIRQALNRENEQMLQVDLNLEYEQAMSGSQTAEPSMAHENEQRTTMEDLRHDSSLLPAPTAPFMTLSSNARSPPLSPVPLSATMIKVQEMQTLLASYLGADAWLMNEILSEIEDDIEERVPTLEGI